MADVGGVGRLIDATRGEPAVLRWLSIHPDGRVVVRRSDNLIGWSVPYEMWVQFCLLRDVYRVVDPFGRGLALLPAVMIDTEKRGCLITVRHADNRPSNGVATAMLAAMGDERELFGTVAWIGERHPVTGFHDDLSGVAELRALAAHCRSG